MSVCLRYILPFELPDFDPKYFFTGQPPKFKGQPRKDQPRKFKVSLLNFPTSETGSESNFLSYLLVIITTNLVIIMELKRNIECSW